MAFAVTAMAMFASCEKATTGNEQEDNKEPETSEEYLAAIDEAFESIISTEWAFESFEPSSDMDNAAGTDDGYAAYQTILTYEAIAIFSPVLSFSIDGTTVTPSVELTYEESELNTLLFQYEDLIYGIGEWGGTDPIFGQISDFAEIRRYTASGFASDDLSADDIADSYDTGELIFTFEQNDLSEMELDDIILNQRVLVAGNNDKIYIEDGKLVVEITDKTYGVSKCIYTAVE